MGTVSSGGRGTGALPGGESLGRREERATPRALFWGQGDDGIVTETVARELEQDPGEDPETGLLTPPNPRYPENQEEGLRERPEHLLLDAVGDPGPRQERKQRQSLPDVGFAGREIRGDSEEQGTRTPRKGATRPWRGRAQLQGTWP